MGFRNILRLWVDALLSGDKLDLASGETLALKPATNDQGALNLGDGTNDLDFKIFLGSTTETIEFNVGDSDVNVAGVPLDFSGAGRTKRKLTAITGNTTLNTNHFGGVVTTRGAAGAVVVTLPAAASNAGEWVEIINVADQNLTVAGQDEELVVFNDLTADSIAFSTAGEKIGGCFHCFCDGTSWLVQPRATETQTVTIASA